MLSLIVLQPLIFTTFTQFIPSLGNFPSTGNDTISDEIFSSSITALSHLYLISPTLVSPGLEAPKSSGTLTNGSGPYLAQHFTDTLLPNHTIYAPTSPPSDLKMPFIVWANGVCETDRTAYEYFLMEFASWGYLIAADGLPGGYPGNASTSPPSWIPEVYLLREINVPRAWFEGGPLNFTTPLAAKYDAILKEGLPVFKASLDTGHYGTYFAINVRKFGTAAVAYLEWQFRTDVKSKRICLSPAFNNTLARKIGLWSIRIGYDLCKRKYLSTV